MKIGDRVRTKKEWDSYPDHKPIVGTITDIIEVKFHKHKTITLPDGCEVYRILDEMDSVINIEIDHNQKIHPSWLEIDGV